jgi:hypothetical protein
MSSVMSSSSLLRKSHIATCHDVINAVSEA